MMSASKTLKKNLSIAVAAFFLAVAAFACWAIEPSKAYADTTDSHLTVASEVHVLVDSEGNPNATVTNDGTAGLDLRCRGKAHRGGSEHHCHLEVCGTGVG